MRSFFARISRRTWIIAVVIAAVLALGVGGVYVYAQASGALTPGGGVFAPATGTPGPRTPGAQKRGHGGHGGGLLQRLIAQGISGSIKVKDASAPGGYATIAFARGTLTSVDAGSGAISVREPDGTTQSYSVPTTARIQAGGSKGSKGTIANLQTGETVVVITKQTQGTAPVVIAVAAQSAASSASQ